MSTTETGTVVLQLERKNHHVESNEVKQCTVCFISTTRQSYGTVFLIMTHIMLLAYDLDFLFVFVVKQSGRMVCQGGGTKASDPFR